MITYPIWLRLMAWLRDAQPIWIESHIGEWSPSYALMRPDRKMVAYRYPGTKIGFVICNEDGTTGGESYIKKWFPA